MQEKDYHKCDYIEIVVKEENAKEVISAYKNFLWQLLSREDDGKYKGVVHLCFCRAHDIACKDRLQLLLVYYEFALNERADLKEKKHHKSKTGILNLIFFTACLLFGVWSLIFYIKTLPIFIGGIILSLLVLSCSVFCAKRLRKIYKEESKKFLLSDMEKQERIDEILKKAKSLVTLSGGEAL